MTERVGGSVRVSRPWGIRLIGVVVVLAAVGCAAVDGAGLRQSPTFANHTEIERLDGSTIRAAAIDGTVRRLMSAAKIPGLGLALFNDRKLVYLKTYGYRNAEKGLPLTPDSVMSAASFSKVAFAYMAMQLVQEGALDPDKPVYEYLPKPLPEYDSYRDLAGDERYKKITARMLLDHTSGFPNLRRFTDDHRLSINFEPGTRFAYSGEGIELLQLVVEKITNRQLKDLMYERVFRPIGMTRSSMVWESRFENDYADGYDEQKKSLGHERRPLADAAGSMQTTPHDFALFAQAVLVSQGLRKETRELMLSPQIQIFSKHEFPSLAPETTDDNKGIRLSYGLGWGLYWTPYGKAFFKEGHDEGWRNYVVCFDDKGMGLMVMTNSSNGEGIYKELLETLQKNAFTPIEWEGFAPYELQAK